MKKKRCILGVGIAGVVLLIIVMLFMIKSRYDMALNHDGMENMATEGCLEGDLDDVEVISDDSYIFESK